MDRILVYPGSIPLDTDVLDTNRNTMIALGQLAQVVLGANSIVDGLVCAPSAPASMTVTVGPGSITQLSVLDMLAYGTLPADMTSLVKLGINLTATSFTLAAPVTSGQSNNYLIQAALLESDTTPVVLPYYNAANPSQPYSGPANSGVAQNTRRIQRVQLQIKAGAAATTGSQVTPPIDNGWLGLYVITTSYGQTTIGVSNIAQLPTAPFLPFKLPALRPGFASGVQTFVSSGYFTVPPGVTQVEVELWGGGSGSYASNQTIPSGGGSGGGYARKRIGALVAGQSILVTVGAGGGGGTGGYAPGAGGTSSFGTYVSATGGSVNPLATVADPRNGSTPAGYGAGGDVNLTGSSGQAGVSNQGGLGGGAPMGGCRNSGTFGMPGTFPGGGASGAGTGANSATSYDGAQGSAGLVAVRW